MTAADPDELAARVLGGEMAALARACRWVDERAPGYRELLRRFHGAARRARRIGITGPPGAGKSTLTDALVTTLRARGERVAVLAIDPTSPFSGGALLGDRIRMQRHALDPNVFIRSLATRGASGGLSRSAYDLLRVVEAWGADSVLLETVGVGQAELALLGVVDSVTVVLMPGAGDDVQANKAGLSELADVLVLNKIDRPGAEAAEADLQQALSLTLHPPWPVPLIRTQATRGEGSLELCAAIDSHFAWLNGNANGQHRRAERERRAIAEFLEQVVRDETRHELGAVIARWVEPVLRGELEPYAASDAALSELRMATPT